MGLQIASTNGEESVWNTDPEQTKPSGAETILFVEDEAFVRDVTREVLRSAGYTVLTVRNASEALTAYSSHRREVSLLLTDVILPGDTGRLLAARLKQENPQLRILFVTGYMEQMTDTGAESADFLAKPFSAASLLAKVRQVLDGKAASPDQAAQVRHAGGNA